MPLLPEQPTFLDALEGVLSLLNPGEYGVADSDPKARLLRDLASSVSGLGVSPVVIGGLAVAVNGHPRQTADVDLLVARDDAMSLVRALEASRLFLRKKLDRWTHIDTGVGLDLCVEGELTHPARTERFPSPGSVRLLQRKPLPVVEVVDLLVLKAASGRAKDEADFVSLAKAHGLDERLRSQVVARLRDPAVIESAGTWWERAREESAREAACRPTWGSPDEAP